MKNSFIFNFAAFPLLPSVAGFPASPYEVSTYARLSRNRNLWSQTRP